MQRKHSALVGARALVLERSVPLALGAIIASILLNGALSFVNTALSVPLFLDTIGTCIVGALFGPIAGGLAGVGTNLFMEVIYGFEGVYWLFGIVNGATGVIVGLLVAKGLFRTAGHLAAAIALIAAVNAALGAFFATVAFGGSTGTEVDFIATGLLLTGKPMMWAAFLARVPVNLVDKAVAVIAAYAAYRAVFLHNRD